MNTFFLFGEAMSLSMRPCLLNPDSVTAALGTEIQPESRSLNCFVTLRPAKLVQSPKDFPPDSIESGSSLSYLSSL